MVLICLIVLGLGMSFTDPLRGTIASSENDQPLVGATVFVEEIRAGAVTDGQGRFSLPGVPPGRYTMRVQHLAFRTERMVVHHPYQGELRILLTPDTFSGDEVIVTATGGMTARYQAAQAFDSETLQRSAAPGLGEMLDGAPGVAMRSFGPVPSRPVIRGLDGDRILVLENGERMGDLAETAADHAVAMDMLALDRIEIVRGPASLLYGSSAIGGVINLFNEDIPRSWTAGTSGAAHMHGASVNRLGAGSARFVYGTDDHAVAARMAVRAAGEMMTPAGVLPGTFLRSYSGAVGYAQRIRGRHSGISIAALGSTYGLPEAIDDPTEAVEIRMWRTNLSGHSRWDTDGFFESIELRLSAVDYGHEEIEIDFEDGHLVEDLELSFHQRSLNTTITGRHRSVGPLTGGSLGANISMRRVDVGGDESLSPNGRTLNLALFALEEIPVIPGVQFSIGARYEYQQLNVSPNDRFPKAGGRRTASTFSGAAGLNIRPTDDVELGAQIARAFRTPRIEELFSDAAHLGAGAYEIGNPDLRNEVATGADAFLSWKPGLATIELSAFSNYIRDFVIYQPTGEIHAPSELPIVVYESDAARLVGGEARLIMPLFGPFSADVSMDYVHGTRVGDRHDPLPFIPPVRGRIALTFDTGRWYAGATTRHVAAQNRVAPGEDATPGYAIFGFETIYRILGNQGHIVGLRLDNVSNRLYRDHLSRIEERDAPMPGRNLNLTYRWIF